MGIAAFLRTLFPYLKPYRLQASFLLILLLVDIVFTTAWPLGFKFLIDYALEDNSQRLLIIILASLLAGVLLASLAALARDYFYAFLSAHVLDDVRVKVFEHLQRLSLDFYSRVGGGDILARFSSDQSALETAITWAIPSLIVNSLSILLGAILLFALEWRLALLTVVGLVLCVLLPRGLARRATQASYEAKDKQASVADTVQENVYVQPVVKAFGLERYAINIFRRQSSDLAQINLRFGFLSYLVERLPNVTILIFEILIIGAGIALVFYGQRTLGTLVAFHGVFLNISASVGGLANVMPIIFQSIGGLRRIEEVLTEAPKIVDVPEAKQLAPLSGALAFRDVSFSYTAEQRVLDRISLEIPRGAFVAFVGPSGSGKSTVLNLILRFYDPGCGKIEFDGQDVRAVTQESLRAQIGVVFQENVLFNISVRENIRLGQLRATDEDVLAAARAAEIHEFLNDLPGGYDTNAGGRGTRFSGGQRQRLALARALVRQPTVLLLDEATSALDPATEAAINATLLRVAEGRTVISVTHRLSTIVGASCIFVMDNGQVREQGTHDELLRSDGLYARLWRKQAGFTLSEMGDHAEVEAERLSGFPILSQLNHDQLAELARQFVTELHPAGRKVIVEGDPGNKFYIIVRGKVEVTTKRADDKEQRLAVLQDGDYLGEIALLKNVPRTATVRTLVPSVFLTLERGQFAALLQQAPQMRESLLRAYEARLESEEVGTNFVS